MSIESCRAGRRVFAFVLLTACSVAAQSPEAPREPESAHAPGAPPADAAPPPAADVAPPAATAPAPAPAPLAPDAKPAEPSPAPPREADKPAVEKERAILHYSRNDLLHGQIAVYGARYWQSRDTPTEAGFGGGIQFQYVYSPSFLVTTASGSRYIEEPSDRTFVVGWNTEISAGAGSANGRTKPELLVDLVGLMARLKLNDSLQVGATWGALVLDSDPVGGYTGSIVGLRFLAYGFELGLSRAGGQWAYGCFVPGTTGDDVPAYAGSLQYLVTEEDRDAWQYTIGVKLRHQGERSPGFSGSNTARVVLGVLL
jgi:hypothetical protein